jgi:hypothetical protein
MLLKKGFTRVQVVKGGMQGWQGAYPTDIIADPNAAPASGQPGNGAVQIQPAAPGGNTIQISPGGAAPAQAPAPAAPKP